MPGPNQSKVELIQSKDSSLSRSSCPQVRDGVPGKQVTFSNESSSSDQESVHTASRLFSIRTGLSLLALVLIVLGSIWATNNVELIRGMGRWGYVGVALISFTSSATVILPAPGLAVVFSMGGVLNPLWLGILAGIASGLGELSGYLAGATGRELVADQKVSPFLKNVTTRHTTLVLFVLAILPIPVFDFAGILAGAIRMRISVFLAVVISGKVIKHVLVAMAGSGLLPFLQRLLAVL